MKLNLIKLNIPLLVIVLAFTFSCDKAKNKKTEMKSEDLLSLESDTLYKREWMKIDYGNNRIEEVEIYVSEYNDTIFNQYKAIKNNQIDTLRSEFYDLKITETQIPNIYNGQVTIHSKYDNLKINKHIRKGMFFHYCEQNKDSMWVSTKMIENSNSNTINFKFENAFGKNLQGYIFQQIERDTLIKKEKMVNLYQLEILVDNKIETNSFFLGTNNFIKKNKFNTEKIKFIKTN